MRLFNDDMAHDFEHACGMLQASVARTLAASSWPWARRGICT